MTPPTVEDEFTPETNTKPGMVLVGASEGTEESNKFVEYT